MLDGTRNRTLCQPDLQTTQPSSEAAIHHPGRVWLYYNGCRHTNTSTKSTRDIAVLQPSHQKPNQHNVNSDTAMSHLVHTGLMCSEESQKSHIETVNIKNQFLHGMINLNYLMGHILYKKLKIDSSILYENFACC